MRLLKTGPYVPGEEKLEVIQKWGKDIPPYAILSHTWSTNPDDEVLLSDVHNGTCSTKPAYAKLEKAMERARIDGWGWLWIDTCCIDKTSSVELSEAINSMYDYYKNAQICYAYLADVETDQPGQTFNSSRWWKRGWTLQELLAPKKVKFFNSTWLSIGDKDSLAWIIPEITGIEYDYLVGLLPVEHASIARRMSWAASRETTRDEDIAYSMIGLFDVNMPMLYGEGATKAFLRLQEEIMRVSEDQSIFAWVRNDLNGLHGLLADSPRDFQQTGNTICYTDIGDRKPATMSARGLNISLPLVPKTEQRVIGPLHCPIPGGNSGWLAVYLQKLRTGSNQYARVECDKLAVINEQGGIQEIYIRQKFSDLTTLQIYPNHYFQLRSFKAASAHQGLADYKIVAGTATRAPVSNIVMRSQPPPPGEPRQWSKVPMVYKIHKTAGVLTTALLVERASDRESFILLLGTSTDSDYEIALTVSETDSLGKPFGSSSFEQLQQLFKQAPQQEYFALKHHKVRVSYDESIYNNSKLYLIDIEIQGYAKQPTAIELLEGAVDSIVPGQGRHNARNDFRDKVRRTFSSTKSM